MRKWADARTDDRPIALAFFGPEDPVVLDHSLAGSRIDVVLRTPYDRATPGALPTRGWFVVSPVALAGVYDTTDPLRPLRGVAPAEVIDGCLLAYDLDRPGRPIVWASSPPATEAAADPSAPWTPEARAARGNVPNGATLLPKMAR